MVRDLKAEDRPRPRLGLRPAFPAGGESSLMVAAAQIDDRGSKMATNVRMMESIPGTTTKNWMMETVAGRHQSLGEEGEGQRQAAVRLPGMSRVLKPMMKMACMGPKRRRPSFRRW
jgi:hypothetical protein